MSDAVLPSFFILLIIWELLGYVTVKENQIEAFSSRYISLSSDDELVNF